ncbi:pilus assembly protein [Paenibacillus pini]|uniref:TadE-like protein n=1 Tax=Paenibacillus pini JCM 16418 TaxID=1236976 RepID=W7YUF5_9BACL|nr:pilus assembly protein [Paenibacillus pini]GAF08211.1 hypothetical protein JCM16418_2252 [Paenibacillus pini JCM 16418]
MQQKKRIFLINSFIQKKGRRNFSERGSMVLEASMVLPLFIFFIIFLIYVVQMTLYSTALQTTASDTVKMVSSHMYPVALAVEKDSSEESEGDSKQKGSWTIPKLSLTDWAAQYTDSLPTPLNQWMKDAVSRADEPLQDLKTQVSEAALDPVIKPILKPFMEDSILNYDRIHVSNIKVPNLKTRTDPYFAIEVSYEMPWKIPLLNKKIVLQAKAQERLWIGQTDEDSSDGLGGHDGTPSVVLEILEKPNPAIVGQRTKVRAKIAPNSTANLSVFYKSGSSTAKYLGEQQADAEGYIEWEWFVGTNTTPGTWPFVVTTAEGERSEVMFTVIKR